MCTFLLQHLFHYTHDGASAKFSTNSPETNNSVPGVQHNVQPDDCAERRPNRGGGGLRRLQRPPPLGGRAQRLPGRPRLPTCLIAARQVERPR